MIATLSGRVIALNESSLIVEVGGVGLLVHVTGRTSLPLSLHQEISLFTSLQVREESLTLFGFETLREREMFDLLQTVTGIGPRVALSVLSLFTPQEISELILSNQSESLTRTPGLGKKGAQRIGIDLREKVEIFRVGARVDHSSSVGNAITAHQLVEALTNLGYSVREAEVCVRDFFQERGEATHVKDLPVLLRELLQTLDRRK